MFKIFSKTAVQLFSVVILYGLSLSAAAAAEEPPALIVLFGDSITAGYNADFASNIRIAGGTGTKGRPTIELKELLAGPPARNALVSNWGWGGTPSGPCMCTNPLGQNPRGSGLSRIDDVVDDIKDGFPGSEYFILIMYGTNDKGYGLSSSTTGFNVEQITRRSQSEGYTAIVGTIPPRSDQSVSSRNFRITIAANNRNAPLVDIFDVFDRINPTYKNVLMDDEISAISGNRLYIHPNMAGYKAIAEEWFYEELESRIDPIPDDPIVIAPMIYLLLED